MRILDPRGLTVSFEALGIEPRLMEIFNREIAKPEGIILTTGPTGSGKTTTLYSFLKRIYAPEIKIITIEDPIEYHLTGIQQTQVNHEKGYDFLSDYVLQCVRTQRSSWSVKSVIRKTAITAIQAAQTGHLVLSTLHTNNAAGVIPRLLVLGVNPGMLASTLRMAIAQRLVRRLVPETRIERRANAEEHKIITAILGTAVENNKDITRFGFSHNASEYTVYDAPPDTADTKGYKGRIGIYEVIVMDNTIEKLLEKNPSEREVRNAAEHQGLLTMQEDAIIKILQGITSFDEVRSVIDLETGYEDVLPSSSLSESVSHLDDITLKNPLPNFHMDAAQLETMWEYLKTLRVEQELAPDDERAEQIRDTERIIMDIMKRNHGISSISNQSASSIIQNEMKSLESELEELREHALKHPDPAIAAKLKQMHAIIDTM
jgi:Tfp pilus assembly pilus retraction ATPase PilT